jgi:adenylate cyclase
LFKLKNTIEKWKGVLISIPTVTALVIGASWNGYLQNLELAVLDRFFLIRTQEKPDDRVIIVGIGDRDLDRIGKWPIDDATLSQALEKIKSQKPTAIGIDLYRNLPVEPGHQKLINTFKTTSNLIGVEKSIGDRVAPAPALAEQDRVAMADLLLDPDGKIRRALISTYTEDGQIKLGLGSKLALMYLQEKNLFLENIAKSDRQKLGKAIFSPIKGKDGGYANIDWGGYQVFLNFRGSGKNFKIVSISDVLAGKIEENLFSDRMVLLGSVAPSLNDYFYTPLSNPYQKSINRMAGVVVHANITSQIVSAALDGRPMIQTIAEPWEWLLIFGCSLSSAIVSFLSLKQNVRQKNFFSSIKWIVICVVFPVTTLTIGSYNLFVAGWWIPVMTPIAAWTGAAVLTGAYYSHQKQQLAFVDSLTQIGNRYSFDRFLERQWIQNEREQKFIALILCDVDYFKYYNDTYGHQLGDDCLKQVARAIAQVVRKTDLVARYGGEEFAVILPNTDPETAYQIAQRILFRVKSLQIPHTSSQVSNYVSLSCGIACEIPHDLSSPAKLIKIADDALYNAKKQGRDRIVLADV